MPWRCEHGNHRGDHRSAFAIGYAGIAYVGSDDAYYVNGAIMAIDGGTTTG